MTQIEDTISGKWKSSTKDLPKEKQSKNLVIVVGVEQKQALLSVELGGLRLKVPPPAYLGRVHADILSPHVHNKWPWLHAERLLRCWVPTTSLQVAFTHSRTGQLLTVMQYHHTTAPVPSAHKSVRWRSHSKTHMPFTSTCWESNTKLSAPLYLTLIWPNCSFSHFSLHFILQILAWYTFLPPSTFLPLNIINSNKNSWSHSTGSHVLCSTPPSAVLSPSCSWLRKFETQRFSPPRNMLFHKTFSIIRHKWLTRALIRFLKS